MKRLLKALLYTLGIVVLLLGMTYVAHHYPIITFSISVACLFGIIYWVLDK